LGAYRIPQETGLLIPSDLVWNPSIRPSSLSDGIPLRRNRGINLKQPPLLQMIALWGNRL
jgi:hypothetical protein